MTSIAQRWNAAVAQRAGMPCLTWYGPHGARVELSAITAMNWVAQISNAAVDEYDVAPGDDVAIDFPMHWLTPLTFLALRYMGARAHQVTPTGGLDAHDVQLLLTDRPRAWSESGLALPASIAVANTAPLAGAFTDETALRMPPPAHLASDFLVACRSAGDAPIYADDTAIDDVVGTAGSGELVTADGSRVWLSERRGAHAEQAVRHLLAGKSVLLATVEVAEQAAMQAERFIA